MKKTFLFAALAAFTLLATSCGDADAEANSIIGTSIRLGNLEVAQKDFPERMTWNEAKQACKDLGAGWRLPTKEELNLLYENKAKVGGFVTRHYWSSTENDYGSAWSQNLGDGGQDDGGSHPPSGEDGKYLVRAVSGDSPSVDDGSVIGTSIRIGYLEVAQKDFPERMSWFAAKKACEDLGAGWRLPTKEELNLMYNNKDKIGGFHIYNFYWSATGGESSRNIDDNYAETQHFYYGKEDVGHKEYDKHSVRAVATATSYGDSDAEAKRLNDSTAAAAFASAVSASSAVSAAIIGTPIRLGNLEVAQKDFPERMEWNEAKQACAILGAGWRLPTKEELYLLYENKAKIGGFANKYYWSSTERHYFSNESETKHANILNFNNGKQGGVSDSKWENYNVRAVRAF
jgi:hypothetical protein